LRPEAASQSNDASPFLLIIKRIRFLMFASATANSAPCESWVTLCFVSKVVSPWTALHEIFRGTTPPCSSGSLESSIALHVFLVPQRTFERYFGCKFWEKILTISSPAFFPTFKWFRLADCLPLGIYGTGLTIAISGARSRPCCRRFPSYPVSHHQSALSSRCVADSLGPSHLPVPAVPFHPSVPFEREITTLHKFFDLPPFRRIRLSPLFPHSIRPLYPHHRSFEKFPP